MPGELREIGRRPKLVASFTGAGATSRFLEWRRANAALLAAVPPDSVRVEYGRAAAARVIRVRIDEGDIPAGLAGPDEAGAAEGLPPRPPAA